MKAVFAQIRWENLVANQFLKAVRLRLIRLSQVSEANGVSPEKVWKVQGVKTGK